MKCIEYVEKLKREGWKVIGLEENNLTLLKNGQFQIIDLRFDTAVKAVGSGYSAFWTNASNIVSSDNVYATKSVDSGADSGYIIGYNCGFNIPTGATINGISVKIEANASVGSVLYIYYVYLGTWNGSSFTIKGSSRNNTTTWTTSDVNYIVGSSSDLWGTTWTNTDFNSSQFGCEIDVYNSGDKATTASIDYVEITITYTLTTFIPQIIII
jgi:hypothetical protein